MALTPISVATVVPVSRGRGNADLSLQISGTCRVEYTLDPDPTTTTAWAQSGLVNPVVDDIVHFEIGITGLKLTPTGTAGYALV